MLGDSPSSGNAAWAYGGARSHDPEKTWREQEDERNRTDQSFLVPKADIVANNYDLSINRYNEVVHEAVEHAPPLEILADLQRLEDEIQAGLKELQEMLA